MTCDHQAVLIPRKDHGTLRPSQKFKRACKFPLYFKCANCHQFLFGRRCGATKEEKCYPCAMANKRYRRIQISEVTGIQSKLIWYTLTGQGQDHLPFDKELCTHPLGWTCKVELGCRHNFIELSLYNFNFKKAHNRFIEAIRDRFPELDLAYLKTLETQERGVLHVHGFIVGNFPSNFDFQNFFESASQVAIGWDFGEKQNWQVLNPVNHLNKISYVTKYITKKDKLAWTLNPETGEIKKGAYHLITKSQNWGRTMKDIKQAEFARFELKRIHEHNLKVLEDKLNLEGVISLLALVLGATPLREAKGCANATPLESTTKKIYRSP